MSVSLDLILKSSTDFGIVIYSRNQYLSIMNEIAKHDNCYWNDGTPIRNDFHFEYFSECSSSGLVLLGRVTDDGCNFAFSYGTVKTLHETPNAFGEIETCRAERFSCCQRGIRAALDSALKEIDSHSKNID